MKKPISKIVRSCAQIALLALTTTVVAQAKDYTFTFPPHSFSLSQGLSTTYNSTAGTVLLKGVPLACAAGLFLLWAPMLLGDVKVLKKPLDFYDKHVIEKIIGKSSHASSVGGASAAGFNLLGITALLAVGLPFLSLATFAGLSVYNGCGK